MAMDQHTTYTLPTTLSCISNHENDVLTKMSSQYEEKEFKEANGSFRHLNEAYQAITDIIKVNLQKIIDI